MRKQEHRGNAFGDVEQRDRNRILPAEDPVDVGGAEVPGAVFAEVDPPPQFAE